MAKTAQMAAPASGRAQGGAKAQRKTEKQPKKPMGALRGALLAVLLMLVLLAAGVSLLFFNVADSRQIAVDFLLTGESPYKPQIEQLESAAQNLAEQNAQMQQKLGEIEQREGEVAKLQRDIAAREESQKTRTAQLDAQQTALEDYKSEFTTLIAIYEKLDAAKCASILKELYDPQDAVRILRGMKEGTISNILSAMDVETAARMTEMLMTGE